MNNDIANKKTVCVLTNGCPENRIDGALVEEFFRRNNWTISGDFRKADLILFNTCALTQYKEDMSIEMVRYLKLKKRADARLIVYGCLSRINKERLQELYQGPTFGSDKGTEQLNDIIGAKVRIEDVRTNSPLPYTDDDCLRNKRLPNLKKLFSLMDIKERLLQRRLFQLRKDLNAYDDNTFCIKICTGCLDSCSYCAVKVSRGRIKSKPIDKIVEEFKTGLSKGYAEFGLLGTDLGPYGRDLDTDLAALLNELIKIEGNYKIKLRNVHPKFLLEMWPQMKEIFKTGKVTYLGCAIESGNNRVLEQMNRKYRIEDVKELIREMSLKFPNIILRTQLMVGFPTETEEEFGDTMRLLDEFVFDFAEVYTFEKRPNTKAARMDGQIPPRTARARYHKLFVKSLFHQREGKGKCIKGNRNFKWELINA